MKIFNNLNKVSITNQFITLIQTTNHEVEKHIKSSLNCQVKYTNFDHQLRHIHLENSRKRIQR